MFELSAILPLLIPVLALLIGLVVVGSIFVIHPLVNAITRLADAQEKPSLDASDPTALGLEQRMAALEQTLHRLLDEQEFDRDLQASLADPADRKPSRMRVSGGDRTAPA